MCRSPLDSAELFGYPLNTPRLTFLSPLWPLLCSLHARVSDIETRLYIYIYICVRDKKKILLVEMLRKNMK